MTKETGGYPESILEKPERTIHAISAVLGVTITVGGLKLINDGFHEGDLSKAKFGGVLAGEGIVLASLGLFGRKILSITDNMHDQTKNLYHKLKEKFPNKPKI